MRAFLAIALDAAVNARLVQLSRTLAAHGSAVRWLRDDARHLTVTFLGDVSEETLAALRNALADALAAQPPLHAAVHGVGVFPHWRRPRIVWAGVRCAGLAELAAHVETHALRLGVAPQAHDFTPHVTLGRVRSARGWQALEPVLRAAATADFGAWTVRALHALQSDLRPDGAVYTKRWSIPFGA